MNLGIMLDLETMSLAANAAIVAIGACKMGPGVGDIRDKFYMNVSLEDCEKLGMHISGSTVMWWLAQEKAAQEALINKERFPLAVVLEQFSIWLGEDTDKIWGNGSDFDNIILRNAYDLIGMECPWDYRANRCFRTTRAILGQDVTPPDQIGTSHNALDDALWQAEYLQRIGFKHGFKA